MTLNVDKVTKTGKITKKGQFSQNARLNGHARLKGHAHLKGHARFKTGDFSTLDSLSLAISIHLVSWRMAKADSWN